MSRDVPDPSPLDARVAARLEEARQQVALLGYAREARRAAIEEAAKVCEARASHIRLMTFRGDMRADELDAAAAEIRALPGGDHER